MNRYWYCFLFSLLFVLSGQGQSTEKNLSNHPANDRYASYSPDGTQIIFESDRDGNWEIYLMRSDGSGQTRLTNHAAEDREPAWHPNGKEIVFKSNREGNFKLYKIDIATREAVLINTRVSYNEMAFPRFSPTGDELAFSIAGNNEGSIIIIEKTGNEILRIQFPGYRSFYPNWAPDGMSLVFFSRHETNNEIDEIYSTDINGRNIVRLTNWPTHNFCPRFSRDGNRIAYVTSIENSRPEIFIMDKNGVNRKQITFNSEGDTLPDWSVDNAKLLITGFRGDNYEILELEL